MITALAAVMVFSAASAAPSPAVKPAAPAQPSAHAAAAPASAASAASAVPPEMLGLSTYTVSTLYTGDRFRDPFVAASIGGTGGGKKKGAGPLAVDIHALQLHGIMQDSKSEFALFSSDDGATLVLRGGRLFGARNKRIPGITGRINVKQKRVELITADKDVQVFNLGQFSEDDKDDAAENP